MTVQRALQKRRRDLLVDLRHRDASCIWSPPASERDLNSRFIDAHAPGRGRLLAGGADVEEDDRLPRSARHPAAGAGRSRRRLDPGLRDLRARHHRRALRARPRSPARWWSSPPRASRACSRSSRRSRASASSNMSISRGRIRRSKAATSTRCASASAPSWRIESPVEADIVVPVPDSGTPAAIGFAQAGRHPLRARHHPQPLCRPHLHPARRFDPPHGREAEAQRQPRA